MSKIFVLDSKYQRLNPVPGRAKMPSDQGKAAIEQQYPLTIILKNQANNCQKKYIIIKSEWGAKNSKLSNNSGVIPGISHKYCNHFQRKNDYKYG